MALHHWLGVHPHFLFFLTLILIPPLSLSPGLGKHMPPATPSRSRHRRETWMHFALPPIPCVNRIDSLSSQAAELIQREGNERGRDGARHRGEGKKLHQRSPFLFTMTQYLTFPVKQHNGVFRSPLFFLFLFFVACSLCVSFYVILPFGSLSLPISRLCPHSSPLLQHPPFLSLDHLIHWCTRKGTARRDSGIRQGREREREIKRKERNVIIR